MKSWNLSVRGLELVVHEFNSESVPDEIPIVCLHGWLDNAMAFAPVAEGQPGRWIGLDQRGFGRSQHIGPGGYYHFADLLPDLDALVESLGKKVHLVGHSMGGTVASMYAAVRPDRVERLVVVEGLGAIEWGEPDIVDRMRAHLKQIRRPPRPVRIKDLEDASARLVKRHTGLQPDHAKLLAEHGTSTDEHGLRWSFDPLHMVRGPYPFRESWYLKFLAAIEAPTLVIWGSESWYPESLRLSRVEVIPNATAKTIPGSHMLPYDAPKVVGQLVTEHLTG